MEKSINQKIQTHWYLKTWDLCASLHSLWIICYFAAWRTRVIISEYLPYIDYMLEFFFFL